MSDTPSRGEDIRNYIPAFKKGAKLPLACISAGFTTGVSEGGILSAHLASAAVTFAKMKATFVSGTYNLSAGSTKAVAHGLAVKPKSVIVTPILTAAQGLSASVLRVVQSVSAATDTYFYIVGNKQNLKYAAYIQI